MHPPLLVLLRLAQHLELGVLGVGGIVPPALLAAAEVAAPAAEEPAAAVHGPQALGGVHQLERVLVLLVVVRVLGAAGAELGVVLVHVAAVLVRATAPVGNLETRRTPSGEVPAQKANSYLAEAVRL